MRRFIAILVVISTVLAIVLYVRLRDQRLALEGPSRGSATIEGVEVDVVARLAARVVDVLVEEGDSVEAGQELVRLDCREPEALLEEADAAIEAGRAQVAAVERQIALAQLGVDAAERQTRAAQAAVEATQAQRSVLNAQQDAAERAVERLEALRQSGGTSEQDLDRVRTQAAVLEAQLRALRVTVRASEAQADAVESGEQAASAQVEIATAQLDVARSQVRRAEAARRRALTAVEECVLRAPRAGYVQTRNFEPGELVMPGSHVISLVDTREVRATFYLPNAELAAAQPGLEVELVADAYPDRRFTGTIQHVAASAEFTPRNVQTREDRDRLVYAVEVRVDNPDNALRPGMPVEVMMVGQAGGSDSEPEGQP
jgi:HlyD family secretion protein